MNRLTWLANAIDPRWVGFMQHLDEAVGESIASGTPSYFKSNWGFSFSYKNFTVDSSIEPKLNGLKSQSQ